MKVRTLYVLFAALCCIVEGEADSSSKLSFELRVPVRPGAARLLGRAFVFVSLDSDCETEPRSAVGDDESETSVHEVS